MNCYIVDLDGTLTNGDHRLHHIEKTPKDWGTYFDECHLDTPIEHMILLVKDLLKTGIVLFVSGRSDQCRDKTENWLLDQGLPTGPLYMRKAGDHRNDDIIKIELLEQIRKDGFNPIMAFDDRNRVVKAWRDAGLPCAQVAEGDF